MNSRLSTIAPDIEEILNAMSDPERMDLATRAIMWVANEFDLDDPAIEKAIKEMHPERLQEISQELDERYFELQELGDPEHLPCFSKARGYSAAVFLAHGNAYEAIYEAIAATDETQIILRTLKNKPKS